MGVLIDLTGERFGRLTVTGRAGNDAQRKPIWHCVCDCGRKVVVRGMALRSGHTLSCGCYSRDVHTKHGGEGSRLYRVWCDMKARCLNKNHRFYSYYGGRGISICEEWLDFSNFQQWAYHTGYDPTSKKWECTLDRIDSNRGYFPDNCRWVSMAVQDSNKRNNRYFEFRGEVHSLREWAEILGVKYQTLYARLNVHGMSVEEAFGKSSASECRRVNL